MRLRLTLILTIASVAGCSQAPPPIGRDLPIGFGYTPYFNDRVSKRFPAGSDANKLLAELRRERFTVVAENHDRSSRYRLSATYEIDGLVCKDVWTIEWTAEQRKIKEIRADSRDLCL
jgi:hypothetical protein